MEKETGKKYQQVGEKIIESEKHRDRGHRRRLRERFIKAGFTGFHDHEILELLLTYAIPQKDTKPIAKDLIEKFGSIVNVLNADIEDLRKVTGIKEYAAVFIKFSRELITRYFQSSIPEQASFSSIDQLVAYLNPFYYGKRKEIFMVLYLNSRNERLAEENLGEGTVNEAVAFPRRIVESALKYNATSVIIAHNHPGGILEPSEQDKNITKNIKEALSTISISLQEHIILNEEGHYSFRKNGLLD